MLKLSERNVKARDFSGRKSHFASRASFGGLQPKLAQITSPISQKDSQWRQRRHGKIYKKLFKEGPHQSEILHYVITSWRHTLLINHQTKPDAGKKFFNVFTVFGGVKLFSTFVLPSAVANFFLQ